MPLLIKDKINYGLQTGSGGQIVPISGICNTIHAQNQFEYGLNHVDPIWDFFDYGQNSPNLNSDGKNHQNFSILPVKINSNCWIKNIFPNPSQRINMHGISVGKRSYGAGYFTWGPWGSFGPDKHAPYYIQAGCRPAEEMKWKFGLYTGATPLFIAISPRVAIATFHTLNNDTTQTVRMYNRNTNTFEDFTLEKIFSSPDTNYLVGTSADSPMNFGPGSNDLSDTVMFKIPDNDPRQFTTFYNKFANTKNAKNWLQNSDHDERDAFLGFTVNSQGLFFLSEIPFDVIKLTNTVISSGVALEILSVPSTFTSRNYSGVYNFFVPRSSIIKNINQPRDFFTASGQSGTPRLVYDKSTNETIVGFDTFADSARAWECIFSDGESGIQKINRVLASLNQPPVSLVTDFSNILKLSDVVDTLPEIPFKTASSNITFVPISKNTPSSEKFVLSIRPYYSKKKDTLKQNYSFIGFKPGVLLQAAELNELQESMLLQTNLQLECLLNWPIVGCKAKANLGDATIIQLSGSIDDIYSIPFPNPNYAYPLTPSIINYSYENEELTIILNVGWYNIPFETGNKWYYVDFPIEHKINLTEIQNNVDIQFFIETQENFVLSSQSENDPGYIFNDRSNYGFVNPSTDGADRYKSTIISFSTEFKESSTPIFRVRKGVSDEIPVNRILIQTLNNYKIFDINI